jgi:competence protein ComEA
MERPRGVSLLLGLFLLLLGIRYGREVLPVKEVPPAFFRSGEEPGWVAFGEGFPRPGVHQIFDDQALRSVIEVALGDGALSPAFDDLLDRPLETGEAIALKTEGMEIVGVSRTWMPAAQRLVLGIPLRPDTMCGDDWQALPGIGPKLAQRIEEDRQKNGEFASLEDLRRVRGIGPSRIRAWRKFFEPLSGF